MENIQNYFIQTVITRGKIIENDDRTLEKTVTETIKDDVECFSTEEEATKRLEELANG